MVTIFYFIAMCVTSQAWVSGETINVTSGVQDYFKAAQHHLLQSIETTEMKIASAEASFAARLDVIHYEQHQMLHEIHQLNQNLVPLESLSLIRKHCIQKYAPQLVTRSGARSEFKICEEKAKLGIESLTSKAKAAVKSAKGYVVGQFVENVKTCRSTHLKNDTALELCYIENVELATKTVVNFIRTAQDYLERNSFESSVISHNTIRCSDQVTSEILKSLGASLRDIENCQKNFILESSLKMNQQNEDENINLAREDDHQSDEKIDLKENEIQNENKYENQEFFQRK